MKEQGFLPLEREGETAFSRLTIDKRLSCTRDNVFMFGGVGLAAAVAAAEAATGREAIWASARFLSYARVGDRLDLSVETLNTGRNVSQVRIVASTRGTPIVSVNAALGARRGLPDDQSVEPSVIPLPEECVPRPLWPQQDPRARLMQHLDVRLAPGSLRARDGRRSADGRQAMWIRLTDETPVDAATLRRSSPISSPRAWRRRWGGRAGATASTTPCASTGWSPTLWVLCDVRIGGVARGFGHGAICCVIRRTAR
ncbi:acyl-CoA thioesterase [Sphingomonas sp. MMS24-JH45]